MIGCMGFRQDLVASGSAAENLRLWGLGILSLSHLHGFRVPLTTELCGSTLRVLGFWLSGLALK